MTDLERLLSAVEAAWPCGDQVRLRVDSRSSRVPRLALVRSREGTSWRLRDDLEPDRAAAVARLAAREPALDADASPPERLHPLCIALAVGGEEVRAERRSAWCHESGGADLLRIRPWDEPPATASARFVGDLWLFW